MTASWVKETQESLCQIRHYLKSDFKIHISLENQCADHCRTYALSDSTLEFKKKCFHKHNMTCDRCDMSKDTLSAIRTAVSSKNVIMRLVSLYVNIFHGRNSLKHGVLNYYLHILQLSWLVDCLSTDLSLK